MDLGISRFHYEAAGRGFSFDRDEALDMRLSPGLAMTAADIVNGADAEELTDILFSFGEERYARLIVSRLIRERAKEPITTRGAPGGRRRRRPSPASTATGGSIPPRGPSRRCASP